MPTAPSGPGGPELMEVDPPAEAAGAAAAMAFEDSPADSRWGVLRHRHFRTIWFAAFGSYVGNWFEFVAVRWIVSQETKSEEWMGYLAAAQLCPTLVLGMLGGLVADSVNRRSLIIVTQAFMMLIALAMAGATFAGYANRWVLLGLTLAQGVTVAFNTPAWQVLTPRLVPKSDLTKAITLNGISFNMARVIGPAIGGVIMKAFQSPTTVMTAGAAAAIVVADSTPPATRGAAALLLFNALTFIGVMLAVLTTPDAPAPPEMRGAWKHPAVVLTRSREAMIWVWQRKGPRAVMLAIVVFAMLATPIMQLLPLMVSEVYHRREDTFGTLLTVMGIGAVTGGLALKLIPKWYPMHHLIPVSILFGGFFILIFSLLTSVAAAMIIMFCIGVFWMWGFNSSAAAMQHLVSDDMRGRVSAVVNTIAMGLMPVGTWIAGAAGHAGERALRHYRPGMVHSGTGTQLGLAFVSATLVLAGLVMLIWRTPEVDGLSPGDPGYDRRPGFIRGLTGQAHRPRS
ncbi:MAG: MFS transporter [Phycisphaerales bacterium]|nr:MFS transporter [Phycisphaerales bacterium]